jgi:hypothetical protein
MGAAKQCCAAGLRRVQPVLPHAVVGRGRSMSLAFSHCKVCGIVDFRVAGVTWARAQPPAGVQLQQRHRVCWQTYNQEWRCNSVFLLIPCSSTWRPQEWVCCGLIPVMSIMLVLEWGWVFSCCRVDACRCGAGGMCGTECPPSLTVLSSCCMIASATDAST